MNSFSKKKWSARSPTRIDLAGGTLDLWPLYTFVGGATTINFGIDIWTEAHFTCRDDFQTDLNIQGQAWNFTDRKQFLESREPLLSVLQEVILHFSKRNEEFARRGFSLQSSSMSPVGGGLGGSSSLLITYLKLFEMVDPSQRLGELKRIELAHNLEARVLKTPTGTQDYFPPCFSGLNIIRYGDEGFGVDVFDFPPSLLNSFFLVYTGRPHHSGLNNFEVIRRVVGGDQAALDALKKIRDITLDLESTIREQNFEKIPALLRLENATRIELSPGFSSPEITQLQAMISGKDEALKICGAGGGGCVLIWAPPEKHAMITRACEKNGFQILATQAVAPFKDS